MDELLRSTGGTRSRTFTSDDQLVDADGSVPVTIFNSAGVQVTTKTATRISLGLYKYELNAADTGILDVYREVWTPTFAGDQKTQEAFFEVVGAFYFSIAELRKFDGGRVENTTDYQVQDLVNAREYAANLLEDECGVSFVPRGHRAILSGSAEPVVYLPDQRVRKIVSASDGGAALAASQYWLFGGGNGGRGTLELKTGVWAYDRQNVQILYEHGHDQPPEEIKKAALTLAINQLAPPPSEVLEDRATTFTDEAGSRDVAGVGPTGFPSVDKAIERYSEKATAYSLQIR